MNKTQLIDALKSVNQKDVKLNINKKEVDILGLELICDSILLIANTKNEEIQIESSREL